MKIGFIGVGKMGEAILKGIIKGGKIPKENIFVKNSSRNRTENVALRNKVNAAQSSKELAEKCDIVFIGVKPYLVANILEEIKDSTQNKIIISMAAAVDISDIENIVPSAKVVRIMPNTPVEVGGGVIGISFNNRVNLEEQQYILNLFSQLGMSEVILEKDMAALTALSGSGVAYVYMFMEALADGAVLNGLRRDVAYRLVANTVLGAAQMVLETKRHPGELKDDVCSPAGSTIEAVRVLEEKGFRSAIIECEKACFNKLQKMN